MLHFNDSNTATFAAWNMLAVGKPRYDHEQYVREMGGSIIDAYFYIYPDEPQNELNARLDGIFAGLKWHDVVIFQWEPAINNARWIQSAFDHVKGFGARVVILVDDIASWRRPSNIPEDVKPEDYDKYQDELEIAFEANFFAQADGIIAHSRAMIERLRKQVAIAGKTLTDAVSVWGPAHRTVHFEERRANGNGIDYAGNINKAPFLKELPHEIPINVYGVQSDDKTLKGHENFTLFKRMDAELVPHVLQGSFGLVWDSDTYPEMSGVMSDYERYNIPAKFSMYLSANEPVIIWKQAAWADFVVKNDLGYAIDSLDEIPDLLKNTDDERYAGIMGNVERIAPLVREGFFFKKAIFDVVNMMMDYSIKRDDANDVGATVTQYHNYFD